MSYHALYRAYRPQTFSEVVGQIHIVKTIQNALNHERLSHAYLFCGPRGTGKTSIAKIIAKAINCEHYPVLEPCNQCQNCLNITKGSNSDVFEIDAASNNGVDEIREIRDKVKYAPTSGDFKVYIIDEVHMLSTGAFNALLKTLEEPPGHVIFILATTESHKIPATIISRCQRFDFKQISTFEIQQHLISILKNQELDYQQEAISLIAQLSGGGMRDALSLLDQVISYADDQIKMEDVHALSGTVDHVHLLAITKALIDEDFVQVVKVIQTLIQSGKNPTRIIDGLINMYRDFLVEQKIGVSSQVLKDHALFTDLTTSLNSQQIVGHLFKLNQLQQDLRFSNHPELMLEVGLLGLGEKTGSEVKEMSSDLAFEQLEQLKIEVESLRQDVKHLEQSRLSQEFLKSNTQQSSMDIALSERESKSEQNLEDLNLPEHMEPKRVTIEQILTDATKNDKEMALQKWAQLSPISMPEYKDVVALMLDGSIVAASAKGFILTYKHEPACNRILREDNKKVAEQIVAYLFDKPYPFNVMPDSFWVEQRQSYLEQRKQGLEPQLKQYGQKLKNVINYNQEDQTKKNGFIDELIDLFGTEIVNIKEEE